MNLKYPKKDKQSNAMKIRINNVFAKLTAKINFGKILYLDSKQTLTTRTLRYAYKVAKERLFVPNKESRAVADRIKKFVPNAEYMTLNEMLDLMRDKGLKTGSVWFDFMGSLEGRKDDLIATPKEDIFKLFALKIPLNNSLYGHTVCLRGAKKVRYAGQMKDLVREYVSKIARQHGYRLTLEKEWTYGNPPMLTQFLRVHK